MGIIAVLLRQEFPAGDHGRRLCGGNSVGYPAGGFAKLRGQRIFHMAPIHHHYELKGGRNRA
ncbi:hypothetical protein KCP76_14225 [Salmonella enterica subsp. enterica serovar Weltevreden]|nr:hypothetical protein KCP76_14225 [Salmonella enterica subsp. enterica serovar Weltevreden]